MSTEFYAKPPRSLLRRYLVAGYALFIIYASLSPFLGWRDQGLEFWAVLTSPLGLTFTTFDAISNLLAYLPFGMLLALTLRTYYRSSVSTLLATLLAMALSASMEYLQMYLPTRTSSNVDIISNSVGGLLGALLGMSIMQRAWFITEWRIGLFRQGPGVDFGLALVMLWMFAQINPSMPMLGNVFITEPSYRLLVAMPEDPFNVWESLVIALNLLMLGALLLTLMHTRRHVAVGIVVMLGVVALAKFVAAVVLLKSWALMLWLNSEAVLGIVVGLTLMAAFGWMSRVWLFWLTAVTALVYLVLVHWVLDTGTISAAMRLYYWRYGHLRNFNGLSQTVSSLFPLLLGGYLWWARASRYYQEGKLK
jgi:VanZ family protein